MSADAAEHTDADLASAARLIGDPSRAALLIALLDGRALTAGELARMTGLAPATVSAHLTKLLDGGLVDVVPQGRHRYVRLAGADVANALEALAVISGTVPVRTLRMSGAAAALRPARLCYGHIAGVLGVQLHDHLVRIGGLVAAADGLQLTAVGSGAVAELGVAVDIPGLRGGRGRPMLRSCLDWTERRPHLAGPIAAAVADALLTNGWIARRRRVSAACTSRTSARSVWAGSSARRRVSVPWNRLPRCRRRPLPRLVSGADGDQGRDEIVRHRSAVLGALMVLLVACTDGADSTSTTSTTVAPTTSAAPSTSTTMPEPTTDAPTTTLAPPDYRATITRTAYGIPHIVADDWAGLGYGQGYAFAQDRACTLIDQVIKVRGERARWFGPGEHDANLNSDFAYRQLGLHDDADAKFANQPAKVADMVRGYVDGFDAELAAEGPHGWCEGAPWVQPITTTDLYAYLNDVLLFASSGVLIDPIATAQPPARTDTTGATPASAPTDSTPASDSTIAGGLLHTGDLGSNGWAIGSALSASGGGMLLANPHFPWEGEKRLWESQLTLTTGELNVYGASLSGVPGVLIGFNDAVAWTHTVSAGYRMTLYQLSLVPGDPTSFAYGDTTEQMTSQELTIDVLQADGTTKPATRTLWRSHYGPMLNLPFGWTQDTAYTYRDANIDNTDVLSQYFGMDAATSLDEFIDVHRTYEGVPWVNTIATSADGRAWYADTAVTPNLSAESIAAWQQQVAEGGLATTVLDNGAILLDGSNPMNEWVDDVAAARPGIIPFDQQPQLERDDFVFNANDSHWLANPAQLLTGYSPLTGPEAVPQSARTRMNAILLTDPAVRGDDDRLSLREMQAAIFSNRGLHAELLRDSVVTTCERTHIVLVDDVPYDLTDACAVLRDWDLRENVDSVGAALWREYMAQFSNADRSDAGALYKVGFDPADPVGTPNTYNDDSDQQVLTPLGIAAKRMINHGFRIDAPLGDMQYDGRLIADGAERIALPGGTGIDGAVSIVGCCSSPNTLGPKGPIGAEVDGASFSDLGYPVTDGDSFVMTVEFTDAGPNAAALLTYGQPDDPASPDFTSQTKLFAAGTFRPVLFTPPDVAAGAIGDPLELTGYRT